MRVTGKICDTAARLDATCAISRELKLLLKGEEAYMSSRCDSCDRNCVWNLTHCIDKDNLEPRRRAKKEIRMCVCVCLMVKK